MLQLHKSYERGISRASWLKSYHTFSFSSYYNEQMIHFGTLRVLNDDLIAEGHGFPMHPHDNMEIITIVLSGEVHHQDSMGNASVIKAGEIQVMSAGTGIMHSEMNNSQNLPLILLQIWVYPNKKNVSPRYQQMSLPQVEKNQLATILSPHQDSTAPWIHQDAYFAMGHFTKGGKIEYTLNKKNHGVYLFLIEGSAEIEGINMEKRDGLGVKKKEHLKGISLADKTQILIMEVPLS